MESYFNYWGKASKSREEMKYHLLVYHSLDVAAVGSVWLDMDQSLQARLSFVLRKEVNVKDLLQWNGNPVPR